MILYILKFVFRFLAGIFIQQAIRFLTGMITRPPRTTARSQPKSKPKRRAVINPKDIVEGRYKDISDK